MKNFGAKAGSTRKANAVKVKASARAKETVATGTAKGKNVSNMKPELVLMNGAGAMTVAGMERIFTALTGKDFTPEERRTAQKKIDTHFRKARPGRETRGE